MKRGRMRFLLALATVAVALAAINSVVGPARPARALSPVVGWLDTVTEIGPGHVRMTGWAATSDCPWCALGIRVKVDGARITDWYYLADTYRPDVGAHLGSPYGNYHGFVIDAAVPASDDGSVGYHSVCIEGQNSGVYNDLSGCRSYGLTWGAFYGGRWPHNPGGLVQPGYFIVSTSYPAQIATAVNNYNTTYSAMWIQPVARPYSRIDVFNDSVYPGATGVVGNTYFYGCIAPGAIVPHVGCHEYWTNITLYTSTMNTLSYAQQTHVMTHEIGHALGLTHYLPGYTASLMRPSVGLASPTLTSYDLANIGFLYPY